MAANWAQGENLYKLVIHLTSLKVAELLCCCDCRQTYKHYKYWSAHSRGERWSRFARVYIAPKTNLRNWSARMVKGAGQVQ
jgi:hypothetical protein